MKRRIAQWLMLVYPAAWRERYGEEFAALVEDSRPGWRGLADIARGAVAMRLASPPSLMRVAFGFALVGLAAAILTSLVIKDKYVSVGAIEGPFDREAVAYAQQGAMKRGTIAGIIDRRGLYPEMRDKAPKEDLIERFRRDVSMSGLTPFRSKGAFRVGFAYSDAVTARAVSRELLTMVIDEYRRQNPAGPALEVLDMPSLPQQPVYPNRLVIVFIGLAGGALLGTVIGLIRRDGPGRTLRFAAFGAVAGLVIVLGGVALQGRQTKPGAEAIVETRETLQPPAPALRRRVRFDRMSSRNGGERTRILVVGQGEREALTVLREILAGIPNATIVAAPAVTPVRPLLPTAALTLGALLGMTLALMAAVFRRVPRAELRATP